MKEKLKEKLKEIEEKIELKEKEKIELKKLDWDYLSNVVNIPCNFFDNMNINPDIEIFNIIIPTNPSSSSSSS